MNTLNVKSRMTSEELEKLELQVRNLHPSWSNAEITAKAVRVFYLNEKIED